MPGPRQLGEPRFHPIDLTTQGHQLVRDLQVRERARRRIEQCNHEELLSHTRRTTGEPTDLGGAAPVNGAHEEVPEHYQTCVRMSSGNSRFARLIGVSGTSEATASSTLDVEVRRQ